MILLAVTADTWIVTGLGFGIVLVLLFCLVFILQGFGWIMQKATMPKASTKPQSTPSTPSIPSTPISENTASNDDHVAVAYALYLASRDGKHDQPTAMISLNQRDTAWNTKSIGLN